MIPAIIHQGKGSGIESLFLQQAYTVVKDNLENPEFNVTAFADEMCMSRMNLHRKLVKAQNCSASGFIRAIRLEWAAELIEKEEGNITQICYDVGFNHPSYFARRFKEIYGMLPSEFAGKKVG